MSDFWSKHKDFW
jgi:hypothetical protein